MSAIQQVMASFGAAATASAGQVVLTSSGTWTVPAGVTSISMVAVQTGTGPTATTVTYASTVVCRALNNLRLGDGGGEGGTPGSGIFYGGGGGGAGGYSGTGGFGASGSSAGVGGNPGTGGSGAGGGINVSGQAVGGGGVGLLGQGTTGAGASPSTYGGNPGSNGTAGSESAGGLYGGGQPGPFNTIGEQGGALSYKNDVAVTPGSTVTVAMAGNGAVRIIWGAGRSFPSTNTGDV